MSFVTFSQRSKSVFGGAMARQITHRISTDTTDLTLAVVQESELPSQCVFETPH